MGEWLSAIPEIDPPESVVPLTSSVIHVGWRRHLGVEWSLDVALCRVTSDSEIRYLPGVVVSPHLRLAIDQDRVRSDFAAWLASILSLRRAPTIEQVERTPKIKEILLRPLTGPMRVREELTECDAYWTARSHVLAEAREYISSAGSGSELEEVISDYPFVVATLPSLKRLWNPARWHMAPSREDSANRIVDTDSMGRPRRVMVPHLAAELHGLLPDGRSLRSSRFDQLGTVLGPLKSRWALECGRDLTASVPCEEALAVRTWIETVASGECEKMNRAATKLPAYISNRLQQTKRGRHVRVGVQTVRSIVPYICPDLSVFPRLVLAEALQNRTSMDVLLLDWIRSSAFSRMIDIVSGHRRETLTARSPDGTMETWMSMRDLPFQRIGMTFRVDNPDYRRAVAMVPGAQPGSAVTFDATGFGDQDAVLTRWLGAARPCSTATNGHVR